MEPVQILAEADVLLLYSFPSLSRRLLGAALRPPEDQRGVHHSLRQVENRVDPEDPVDNANFETTKSIKIDFKSNQINQINLLTANGNYLKYKLKYKGCQAF